MGSVDEQDLDIMMRRDCCFSRFTFIDISRRSVISFIVSCFSLLGV